MSGFREVAEGPSSAAKKPLLTFKLQKNPLKIKTSLEGSVKKAFFNTEEQLSNSESTKRKLLISIDELEQSEVQTEIEDSQLSYTEPTWGGTPECTYILEEFRSGVILNEFDLSSKNYHVVGNSLSCDIPLTYETVSQFHAVLQYRKINNYENKKGMYIYDLNTVHGTFLNGNRIAPNSYILLHGGYMISFGQSQTKFILNTSKDNEEKEAELSATELEELKRLETQEKERLIEEHILQEKEEQSKKEKEMKPINWGIAEDVDENSRCTESSETAESDNEDLFLADPKKALKDWFKWEGYTLEYETEDRGFGRFYCSIDLILDPVGTTETVEVTVAGDKMKAIDECTLKACRILNKYGFLRQAHEEKKSISRNWEDVDFYDSDEDNFLDRTGMIEKKRQQRMQIAGKLDAQIDTHNSLLKNHSTIVERIKKLETLIASQNTKQDKAENSDDDALDAFMSKLNTSVLNKTEIQNLKVELHNLRQEEMLLQNSININSSANSSKFSLENTTEKTKNHCRFNV